MSDVQLVLDCSARQPLRQAAPKRANGRVATLKRMREEIQRLRERDAEMTGAAREREEQLRLAGQVQSDLLPGATFDASPLSVHTLYLPADHISGDIYDVQRLDEDHFSFSIGDASGHGLPAALLTFLIRNSFRGREMVHGSCRIIEPAELLRRLNEELLSTGLSHCQFITGLHAIFDRTSHQIRWARGGSPYPILLRPGERPRQIRSGGSLMGVLVDQTFETVTHQLEPGDTLLFYTDGLEALLLDRHLCCGESAILRSGWLEEIAVNGPEAALADIRERIESGEYPAHGLDDDITAMAIRMN